MTLSGTYEVNEWMPEWFITASYDKNLGGQADYWFQDVYLGTK